MIFIKSFAFVFHLALLYVQKLFMGSRMWLWSFRILGMLANAVTDWNLKANSSPSMRTATHLEVD